MKKYFSSGLIIFYNIFLVGMETEKVCPSIKSELASCATPKCKKLVDNYVECTRVLGKYAEKNNKEAFSHAWAFHKKVREYELNLPVAKKDQQVSGLDTAIQWYKKSYNTEENIKKHIDKLTQEVFKKKDGEMLSLLFRGRKLAIPGVKTKDLFESLWVIQDYDLVDKYHDAYGYGDKQKTREWIIKNCKKPDFIEALVKNNYIDQ